MLLNYMLVIFLSYFTLTSLLLFQLDILAFRQEWPSQFFSVLGQCGLQVKLSTLLLQVLLIFLLLA